MAPQRKVMVAVDKSEDSMRAVKYALQEVCTPNDRLLILHVRPPIQMMYPGVGAGDFIMPPELFRELQQQAKQESEAIVNEFLALAAKAQIPCDGFHAEGDARDHIIIEAKKRGVDLLVLGSRGMGAVKRALLGSVSSFCVNHASCPVLIVRRLREREATAPKAEGKRTIVFAVDKSNAAKEAFRWAIRNFCRPGQDQLVVVTAQPMPLAGVYAEFTTEEMEARVERDMLQRNRTLLAEFVKEATDLGLECGEDIIKGDARDAILWAVDKHQADLLVVGSRGLGALSRLFLGSVSSHCCHSANCPVLVVRPQEEHKEVPTPGSTQQSNTQA